MAVRDVNPVFGTAGVAPPQVLPQYAAPPVLGGLLGEDALRRVRRDMLLGMSAQFFGGAGRSLDPAATSFGPTMGNAIMAGLQSRDIATGREIQAAQAEQQAKLAAQQAAQVRILANSDPDLSVRQREILSALPPNQALEELMSRYFPAAEETKVVGEGAALVGPGGEELYKNPGAAAGVKFQNLPGGGMMAYTPDINSPTGFRELKRWDSAPDMTDLWSSTDDIRNDWESTTEYQNWIDVRPRLEGARSAINTDTAAADLNIIYALAKAMDPGSVVREGEFKLTAATQSPAQQMIGWFNWVVNSGGRLTPPQRREFLAEIERLSKEHFRAYKHQEEKFRTIAGARGLPANQIFGTQPDSYVTDMDPNQAGVGQAPGMYGLQPPPGLAGTGAQFMPGSQQLPIPIRRR